MIWYDLSTVSTLLAIGKNFATVRSCIGHIYHSTNFVFFNKLFVFYPRRDQLELSVITTNTLTMELLVKYFKI